MEDEEVIDAGVGRVNFARYVLRADIYNLRTRVNGARTALVYSAYFSFTQRCATEWIVPLFGEGNTGDWGMALLGLSILGDELKIGTACYCSMVAVLLKTDLPFMHFSRMCW